MPEPSRSSPIDQPSDTNYSNASSSTYVDPDALADMKNVRWRHNKVHRRCQRKSSVLDLAVLVKYVHRGANTAGTFHTDRGRLRIERSRSWFQFAKESQ